MKRVMFMICFLGGLGASQAQPALPSLQRLADFYVEIKNGEIDLVDSFFYIDYLPKRSAEQAREESESCRRLSSFKVSTPERITAYLALGLERALEFVYETTDVYLDKREQMQSILNDLRKEMTGKRVEVCVDRTIPSYSDGHKIFFVRVEGETAFGFEMGYPD